MNALRELSMDEVAAVIAADIPEGSCVNLGIGLPLRVASFVPAGREIVLHSEMGSSESDRVRPTTRWTGI